MKKRIINLILIVFVIISNFSVYAETTPTIIINNGRLRFGTGSEASINDAGNLKQPWYYNPDYPDLNDYNEDDWYKLTFSSNALEIEIREGGDGSNEWNLNGERFRSEPLNNMDIDTSLFNIDAGSGIIVVNGNIEIEENVYLNISHRYQLLPETSFLKVTTTFTNSSESIRPLTNLRYWVGTRDDWVGVSDGPIKVKGNLSPSGQFEEVTSSFVESKALKIYTEYEAVLFYTESNRGKLIIGRSYGWDTYIIGTEENPPHEFLYNSLQSENSNLYASEGNFPYHDSSYAFFVRMNDLSIGESDEFTWYYAAGSLENIETIIGQVSASIQTSITDITYNGAKFTFEPDIDGTLYYIVVHQNATVPTNQQIIFGVNYSDTSVAFRGNQTIQADVERTIILSNLLDSTDYSFYYLFVPTGANVSDLQHQQVNFSTSEFQGYSITYNLNGGENNILNPTKYSESTQTINLQSPSKVGFTFIGWVDEQGNFITSIPTGSTGNRVFEARYTANYYAVNFDSMGGTAVAPAIHPYLTEFDLPTDPIRPGYSFEGWYWDKGYFSPYLPITLSFDYTVYAKWKVAKQVTILDRPISALVSSSPSVMIIGLVDAVAIGDLDGIETVVIELEANDTVLNQVRQLAQVALKENNLSLLKSYDIALFKTVTPINGTPNRSRISNDDLLQTIKVYMPVPAGVDVETVQAVFIDDQGNMEILESWIEEEEGVYYVVFETDHFSYYGLVGQSNQSDTNTPPTSTIPRTDGSNHWTLIWFSLAILMIIIEIVTRKKRSSNH